MELNVKWYIWHKNHLYIHFKFGHTFKVQMWAEPISDGHTIGTTKTYTHNRCVCVCVCVYKKLIRKTTFCFVLRRHFAVCLCFRCFVSFVRWSRLFCLYSQLILNKIVYKRFAQLFYVRTVAVEDTYIYACITVSNASKARNKTNTYTRAHLCDGWLNLNDEHQTNEILTGIRFSDRNIQMNFCAFEMLRIESFTKFSVMSDDKWWNIRLQKDDQNPSEIFVTSKRYFGFRMSLTLWFHTQQNSRTSLCLYALSVSETLIHFIQMDAYVLVVQCLRVASFELFVGFECDNFLLVLCTNISQLRARPTYRSTNINFQTI